MYPITLGYALMTGVLSFTLRARLTHVKSFLRFYRRIVQTTATEDGSVDFASLHGCNLLGQRICPWMDGSRTTQEQLPRSITST